MSLFARLFLAGLLALVCVAASAHGRERVRLELIDRETARSLPVYPYGARHYVPGTPGHRYAVRLTNLSGAPVLAVLSVDGVNAVTGEDADPMQSGYVLAPVQVAEIAGWRKSLSEVAQFVFTDLADSYAARTGRPDNVGVVGIAVFDERRAPPEIGALSKAEPRGDGPAAPAAESALRDEDRIRQRLGTGYGQREWAPTRYTAFERASQVPVQVSERHYDDRARLVALGVIPGPRPLAQAPRAFPGGFVADPW